MKQLRFKCTFLTDVVLNTTAATEGNNTTLDYIPGANFLGITAQQYNEYKEDAYTVFHSGLVRFGDAHISYNGLRSFKMPVSFFLEKGMEITDQNASLYIHHKISDNIREENRRLGKQLKQIRTGYFVVDGNNIVQLKIDKSFSLKSAHDVQSRKSKEGQIYGYESLATGTEWIFDVEIENETFHLLDKIKQSLIGTRRIGRSKTAEYGLVEIEFLEERNSEITTQQESGTITLYVESCLSFVDKIGQPTLQPEAADLGFPGTASVNWEKSQIVTRIYSPWNNKRKVREADRVCIDKGSVIIVEGISQIDQSLIKKGLGCYTNEGYGKVVINPSFLNADEDGRAKFVIKKQETCSSVETNNKNTAITRASELLQHPVYTYLYNCYEAEQKEQLILKKVDEFVKKEGARYKKIKPSQWGSIRKIASRSKNYEELDRQLFHEMEQSNEKNISQGYLTHGIAKEEWEEQGRLEILKDTLKKNKDKFDITIFTALLASAMAKKYKSNENKQ